MPKDIEECGALEAEGDSCPGALFTPAPPGPRQEARPGEARQPEHPVLAIVTTNPPPQLPLEQLCVLCSVLYVECLSHSREALSSLATAPIL